MFVVVFKLVRQVPLESHIQACQENYYAAISACHAAGNADAFVEFMLEMIDRTLDSTLSQINEADAYLPAPLRRLLDVMAEDVPYTAAQLMARLGLKSRDNFRRLYLAPALQSGLIVMNAPDHPTSRNQAYIKK